MKVNKGKIFYIILFGIISFLFWGPQTVKAAHNVTGWAWSETLGWISFNCDNQGTCASVDYGVDIDTSSGNFSGYAWSENFGWIRFDPPKDPDTNQYPEAPQQAAKLDGNQVKGWARACVGTINNDCISSTVSAWDGWIKMTGSVTGGGTYGVIDANCLLSGYAWAGDAGWISFRGTAQNGMVYGVSDSICPNPAPIANALSINLNFCSVSPAISFSWIYSDALGESQKKFEFQVDNNNDFTSPEIDRAYDDLDWPSPGTNNQSVLLTSATESDKLTYNGVSYYWRVRVWDESNNSSFWTMAGSAFSLPVHAYPSVNFVWAPLNPGVNEETQFLDESRVFGSSLAYRLWTFPSAAFITDKTDADLDPKAKFTICGSYPISLRIDDSTGYSCALTQTLDVRIDHCWIP